MTILPYVDRREKHPFFKWVDFNTVKNTQCIISNLLLKLNTEFFQRIGLTNQYIGVMNFPLRAWNCINAFQDQSYWKMTLDVLAFSSLFFHPHGTKAAILMDLASEAINVYIKINKIDKYEYEFLGYSFCNADALCNIDCTIRENALKILDLCEEELQDSSALDIRYQLICREYDKRIKFESSEPCSPFLEYFKRVRNRLDIAYDTLRKE